MKAKYPSYFTTPCSAFEITEGPRRLLMERKEGGKEGEKKEEGRKGGEREKGRRVGSGRKEGKMNEFWYRASPVLDDKPWTSGTSSDSFFASSQDLPGGTGDTHSGHHGPGSGLLNDNCLTQAGREGSSLGSS